MESISLESIDMQALTQSAVTTISEWGGRVLAVVIILIVGRWLARRAASLVEAAMGRARLDATLQQFGSSVVRYAVLAFAVVAALEKVGVEATSFVAVLGAAGFAVGLALQGSLGNFSAGVMLLFFRPYDTGDFVTVGGETGTVVELSIFSTTLCTLDEVVITVPNGGIFGGVIRNMTRQATRRVDCAVGVAYGADHTEAKRVLVEALMTIEGVLAEPAPDAYLMELGASSVDFQLRAYAAPADYWAVRERMLITAKRALERAGISIPFPQLDVHLDQA